MTERRWMSMDEVFDQLEEAETEHVLQLWERRQREAEQADRCAPEVGPTSATVARRRVRAAR